MSVIVSSAVSHLKALETNMRAESHSFKQEDIEHCDTVAELLHELESEVKRFHNELETETIKNSVLRHKISYFDSDLKKEIDDNIRAARDSNALVINSLRSSLDSMSTTIRDLNQKDMKYSSEIKLLQKERDALVATRDNIVRSLNSEMAEKAAVQIVLNETREKLKDTNEMTVSIEEDMIALNEQLVVEKTVTRDKKAVLEDSTNEIVEGTVVFDQMVAKQNREIEDLQEKFEEVKSVLNRHVRENNVLKHTIAELQLKIQDHRTKLIENENRLQMLKDESVKLADEETKMDKDYEDQRNDLIKNTKEAKEQSQTDAGHLKELKKTQDELREQLKIVYDKNHELQTVVTELNKSLTFLKGQINAKTQEMVHFEVSNEERMRELSELQITSNQTMEVLQKEMEELKDQLKFENETRTKNQEIRQEILDDTKYMNGSIIALQTESSKYFTDAASETDRLTKLEKELNELIAVSRKSKANLEIEVAAANKNLDGLRKRLANELEKLGMDIADFEIKERHVNEEKLGLMPEYNKLSAEHAEALSAYDKVKKAAAEVKIKKNTLENQISKLKNQTEDHESSRENYRMMLVERREETLRTMQSRNQESLAMENNIFQKALRVETLKAENDRFRHAIAQYEANISQIDVVKMNAIKDKKQLKTELARIQEELVAGWQADKELLQLFETADLKLIDEFADQMEQSSNRERQIDQLTAKFVERLKDLDGYLGLNDATTNATDATASSGAEPPATAVTASSSAPQDGSIQATVDQKIREIKRAMRNYKPETNFYMLPHFFTQMS